MWHKGGPTKTDALSAVERAAAESGFVLDAAQRVAAERLGVLAAELGSRGRWRRDAVRGVYLWGPPGRGKSWITDTWYRALPPGTAYRVHFHDFFRRLQDAVFAHRDEAGAIDTAMSELVGRAAVVCFDEFHVHDPGDAMLVTRLLRELFERRTTLVATSNYPPDGLLPNPLHHHLFEPAIRLVEDRLDVVEVAGPRDYRTLRQGPPPRSGFRAGALITVAAAGWPDAYGLTAPRPGSATPLLVNRRTLTARAVQAGTLWIDYPQLCETTTSTADYVVLAERFDTWVVDAVPAWQDCSADGRQRLGSVVDIAYDRDIRLFLAGPDNPGRPPAGAAVPPDHFRTASRLAQLQVTG